MKTAYPIKPNAETECHYIYFKVWEKNGNKRAYMSDYKGRTLGYIDLVTWTPMINDRQGIYKEEVDYAINAYIAENKGEQT